MFLVFYLLYAFSNAVAVPITTNLPRKIYQHPGLENECVCPRSVSDIVWSCITTIVACSWVSIHPNIPEKGIPWWRNVLRRCELMFWAIIAPEFIMFWAMRQRIGAGFIEKKYKKEGWTKTHGHFLQVGGFILHNEKGAIRVLSEERLEELLQKKAINLPSITEDEIQDRSKGDSLSKAVVIVQTTWFITQCVARLSQGLVITELELVTLALGALNGVIYFAWWNKPLNVQSTVPVLLAPGNAKHHESASNGALSFKSPEQIKDEYNSSHNPTFRVRLWKALGNLFRLFLAAIMVVPNRVDNIVYTSNVDERKTYVKTFYSVDRPSEEGLAAFLSFIGCMFGGIHLAGWNLFFPSTSEATIWRVSSSTITVIPWISTLVFSFGSDLSSFSISGRVNIIYGAILAGGAVVYVPARLLLFVEAIISLRDLPPDALEVVSWTLFIPHV